LQDASTSRAVAPSKLIVQQVDQRITKARAFLRDDGSILTVWVAAGRDAWEEPESAKGLEAILASFDLAPR